MNKTFTLIIIITYRHEKEKAQPSISTANLITLAPKVLKDNNERSKFTKSTFLWNHIIRQGSETTGNL